jgi:prevent-host-death family protein
MVTRVVNTHDAKSRLSELIREAEEGTEVIIARNGHPVARLVPWKAERPTRVPGAWAGRVQGSDDAVASDDELVAMFEASDAASAP